MIAPNPSTQQCFAVPNFFAAWNACHSCFDRPSAVIHSSSMGLQDAVDNTSKTEKEMGLSHHHYDDFGEHQCDGESSSSLLSYLVADTVDRVDPGYIKGGSFPFA